MMQTRGSWLALVGCGLALAASAPVNAQHDNDALVKRVVATLNDDDSIKGSEENKSYKVLLDAYLKLSEPPFAVGPEFNHKTIHPKMSTWSAVSGWAESNSGMAKAILACKNKNIFGLPYGRNNVPPTYQTANLCAEVAVGGSLRDHEFPYLKAIDTIEAFTTAEIYRLMEAGQTQQALDLAIANCFVVRQLCDREFLAEKLYSINLLSDCLSNLRDVFYLYQDKITAEQFTQVAMLELPFLRPDRNRLFMPEADRIASEALLEEVFDETTRRADIERFTEAFTAIQSKRAPLTRFGAAKRWRNIAVVHGSLDASQERLKLIYDDWWRRWRVDAYDDILNVDTEFERTNPIRYAAVVYALQDVEILFEIRNLLVAEVNGTSMAAGLCAYKRTYGTYPDQSKMTYTQFVRKRSDSDPYDKSLQPFKYWVISSRHALDTPRGRLWLEPGECVLYAQGQDHQDNRAQQHSDDAAMGDFVLWPPIKAISRAQGLME